jgi:hypothetical protein
VKLKLTPLSYMMFLQRGYLQNQVAYTNFVIIADDLSKYGSLSGVFLPFRPFSSLAVLTSGHWSTGNSTISNQLVAGSIIVRHMKSISVPSDLTVIKLAIIE